MASNDALGLYVDGVDMKVAHVERRGRKIILQDLFNAKLAQKLEVGEPVAAGVLMDAQSTETIDLTQATATVPEESGGEGEENASVITEVFDRYKKKKSLALGVGEPYVFYHPIEVPEKQKRDKIVSRIIEELQATRAGVSKEQVQLLSTTSDTSFVGVVREQELPVVDLVMSARPFLGARMPRIKFVESSDIALVNLVKTNYPLRDDEISVIVYVGVEYTRLIFMRGRNLFNIAPIISEGADSYSVQNTIYSRILLGQDNLSLPRIDQVILCGECKNFDIKGFLSSLLVGADVDYLQLRRIDVSQLPAGGADLVPQYAVPIANATRAAVGKSKSYYEADLTPYKVRESQKIFKLAWHGLLLAVLVFGSTFFFTYNYSANQNEISRIRSDITVKKGQAAEVSALRSQIKTVQSQFGKYSTAVAILDSLAPNTQRWSTLMGSLSQSIRSVGAMWLTNVRPINESTYSVEGYSVYRDRIPRFAQRYPGSVLKKVMIQEIRSKRVYNFQIDLKYSGK